MESAVVGHQLRDALVYELHLLLAVRQPAVVCVALTPARKLPGDCVDDFGLATCMAFKTRRRGHRATGGKHELLHEVRKRAAVFLVLHQRAVQRVRIEVADVLALGFREIPGPRLAVVEAAAAEVVRTRDVSVAESAAGKRMLGVVAVPLEAFGRRIAFDAVAERDDVVGHSVAVRGRVTDRCEMRCQQIADEVGDVEVDGEVAVAGAVGVEPADKVVVSFVGTAVALQRVLVERVPRVGLAFHDAGRVPVCDLGVVVLVPPEVVRGVVLVDALLGLVDAPVDSVDEEMVVEASVVGLAHVPLRVAREDVV